MKHLDFDGPSGPETWRTHTRTGGFLRFRHRLPMVGILVAAGVLGCVDRVAAQDRIASADLVRIYAAVLGGAKASRNPVALERHLLSDSGTFAASGLLPDTVVRFLLRARVVSEVCESPTPRGVVPECIPERADGDLRFSRPIPVGRNRFRVYVARASVRPRSDTSTAWFQVGGSKVCEVTKRGAAWHRSGCRTHMVM